MLILGGFTSNVSAAFIGTQEALQIERGQDVIATAQMLVMREDVKRALVDMGVDPVFAAERIAALSDQDLAQIEGQLDTLPAGGSVLGLIGAVFVVLLILELTGVIDIFKNT
ncbi:MAG: PA2779 family protein [Xanthomonadales bacterium]